MISNKQDILQIDNFYKNENLSPQFISNIKTFEEVVLFMVDTMNSIHQVNYSYKFWKLILIDYVNRGIQNKEYLSQQIDAQNILKNQSPIEKAISLTKSIKSIFAYIKIKEKLASYDKLVHGFHFSEIVEKEIGPSFPDYYPLSFGQSDKEKRTRAKKLAEETKNLFYKNLILQLPSVLVEQFESSYHSIPLFRPEKKEFHVSLITSRFNKLIIAKYIENGAKLFYYQHGGGGGEIPDRSIFHDSSYSTNYMTWGWKINETEIPSKAYRCEGFKKLYSRHTGPRTYDFALVYSLVLNDPIYFNFYKSHTDTILSSIDHTKFKKIIARPRRTNRWKNASSELKFITDSRVKIDSGQSPMTQLIYQSKVVVIFTYEWPQTNFSECLYVNHPVVSIVANMNCTNVFQPYYDFFIENSVFHLTSESLVNHLNTVDIDKWWNELTTKKMYLDFKHLFLREV